MAGDSSGARPGRSPSLTISGVDPMSADGFSLPEIEKRLTRFLAAQGLDAVTVEGLRRFTVGFSWVTFGFEARWREAQREARRRMILRLGPPNGIFAPY